MKCACPLSLVIPDICKSTVSTDVLFKCFNQLRSLLRGLCDHDIFVNLFSEICILTVKKAMTLV